MKVNETKASYQINTVGNQGEINEIQINKIEIKQRNLSESKTKQTIYDIGAKEQQDSDDGEQQYD